MLIESIARAGWMKMIGEEAHNFSPDIVKAQHRAPSPLARTMLYALISLFGALLAWSCVGRLDIVAIAQRKQVPRSYLKIVQPAEAGITRELFVQEGQSVGKGQLLAR